MIMQRCCFFVQVNKHKKENNFTIPAKCAYFFENLSES